MLKRINYISSFVKDMTDKELEALADQAAKKNAGRRISSSPVEGPEESIDRLFSDILKDPRHEKIITLGVQFGDLKRLFPNWHMKEINLDTTPSERMEPVRAIIDAVHAQSTIIENLTEALAASAWSELLDHPTKK